MPLSPRLLDVARLYVETARLETFESLDELRRKARLHELTDAQCAALRPGTHGLRIQIDELVGGNNYRILIQQPMPESAFAETFSRLWYQNLNPSLRFQSSSEQELLSAFVLLHEIAHVFLRHALMTNERDEAEADRWALAKLVEHGFLLPLERDAVR